MKFCDERIQKHLLNGGKIKKSDKGIWKYRPIVINEDNVLVFADSEEYYTLSKQDLTTGDWEIVEAEYNWDKIIEDKILCQFWDEIEDADEPRVGYLARKTEEGFYVNGWNYRWNNCKPFNPADFNIAKNIKEYEE